MEINTNNERATLSQKMVVEMLLADVPETGHNGFLMIKTIRMANFPYGQKTRSRTEKRVESVRRETIEQDVSHPNVCRFVLLHSVRSCVRACREEQANDVIGVFGRGAETKIVFDTDVSMGKACGLWGVRSGVSYWRFDA